MDQVTRKRMHKELPKAFDGLVDGIESTTLMPSMAMRPVGTIHINGEPYELRVVIGKPDSEPFEGQDT